VQTIAYLANHLSFLAPPNGSIERSASGFRPEFLSPKHATPDVRRLKFLVLVLLNSPLLRPSGMTRGPGQIKRLLRSDSSVSQKVEKIAMCSTFVFCLFV